MLPILFAWKHGKVKAVRVVAQLLFREPAGSKNVLSAPAAIKRCLADGMPAGFHYPRT